MSATLDWFVKLHIVQESRQLGNMLEDFNQISRSLFFAARTVGDFAEKFDELNQQFMTGSINAQTFVSELTRAIPLMGDLVHAFDQVGIASGRAALGDDWKNKIKDFQKALKEGLDLSDVFSGPGLLKFFAPGRFEDLVSQIEIEDSKERTDRDKKQDDFRKDLSKSSKFAGLEGLDLILAKIDDKYDQLREKHRDVLQNDPELKKLESAKKLERSLAIQKDAHEQQEEISKELARRAKEYEKSQERLAELEEHRVQLQKEYTKEVSKSAIENDRMQRDLRNRMFSATATSDFESKSLDIDQDIIGMRDSAADALSEQLDAAEKYFEDTVEIAARKAEELPERLRQQYVDTIRKAAEAEYNATEKRLQREFELTTRRINQISKMEKAIAKAVKEAKLLDGFSFDEGKFNPSLKTSIASTLGESIGTSVSSQMSLMVKQVNHLANIEKNTKKLFRGFI